ncbi:MAG: hypothetical protein ACPG8A_13135 [Psychrobium sp.]
MSTVKHYKDLGLEFVAGDKGVDEVGTYTLSESHSLNNHNESDDETVIEFAWRKNTGEKPAYRGEIEAKTESGSTITWCFASDLCWSLNAIGVIKSWRPLLIQANQQQEKPIFTQEMANANESVPVGAEFMACDSKWNCSALHVKGGVIGENKIGELRRFSPAECQPIKTQKDIEIDMISEILQIPRFAIPSTKSVDEVRKHQAATLHNEGYRVTKVEE